MSKRQLQQVSKWIGRWKPRLLLDKWAVMPKIVDKDPVSRDGRLDMAVITVDEANSEGWLTVYPRIFGESKEYQEMCLIHELAHIHTEHIRIMIDKAIKAGVLDKQEAVNSMEDLTNSIAKIVFAAYRRKKVQQEYHL